MLFLTSIYNFDDTQCHCYVCDSPAPCLKWGDGLSTTDHCHATDKSEIWKTLRQDSLSASNNSDTSSNVVNSQPNHMLPLETARLSPNSVLVNRTSRSSALLPLSANLIPQNQANWNACSSLSSRLQNQVSRSAETHPLSVNLMPQNQATRQITMNACSSLGSGLQNQASRSTATHHPLSVNLMPHNQVSRQITMNACYSLGSGLQNQASRSTATHPLSVNLMPQNQVSRQIAMNACYSLGSGLQNQASRSTATNPLSVNLMPQNQVSRQITMNACSSLVSGLQNQASRSTATHPNSVNLIPQNQASQPITINAMSLQNYRLQNQISRPNNAPGCSTASNFTIPNGANNGICQESGPTLARNRYPSNTAARIPLGVRNHAIQKKRGHGVGTGNPGTMNHVTAPGAPGFSNHINTQYSDRSNAAATGFSNSRNGYGQDGVRITNAINPLLTQPSHSPAYETQPSYQSNSVQNLYGYNNFQGDESLSSYVARLNTNRYLNEHQIGSQNENIINSGATVQDAFQQKPHGEIQDEGLLARDSSWAENTNQNISYVQNLASQNISQNENESSTPFNGNTRLSLDDIKHFLFDSS